jgi:flagellar biosynthesis activator protein FlaF
LLGLISLALWVARYSGEVLRAGADIEPLIDINRTMMEGLAAR